MFIRTSIRMASAVVFMFGMMLVNCSETQALQFGSEHSSISINSALPSESFQIAKATFLPYLKDSEIGFGDNELDGDYNSKKCRGYDATSCPAGAVCKRCPFDYTKVKIIRCGDGWAKSGDICTPASCSAINSKYIDSVPKGKICTAVTEYNKLCYKDCRDVSCEGYTLDCENLPENAENMVSCKDCTSANANCEANTCKISQCADGYKIANNGTTCVALDDTCPEGYYKECETGFEGSPEYTEKGTACYKCKANGATCEEMGFHTMDYWESQKPSTSSQIFIPNEEHSILAWVKELVGIKEAKALVQNVSGDMGDPIPELICNKCLTSADCVNSNCRACPVCNSSSGLNPGINTCLSEFCKTSADCDKVICKNCLFCKLNSGGIIAQPLPTPSENWTFEVTETCPYDSNYVKGVWKNKGCELGYVLSGDKCVYADAKVGDILYSDLSTYPEIIPGRTPIGVVSDAKRNIAIALEFKPMAWTLNMDDIPDLPNIQHDETDLNGKENTKTIIEYLEQIGAPEYDEQAPIYSYNYTTEGTKVGDWYLPAISEFDAIYENKATINKTLDLLGHPNLDTLNSFQSPVFWSSSEFTKANAWYFFMNDGMKDAIKYKEQITMSVLPVINFRQQTCTAKSCSGYTLTSCPANGNCSTCQVKNSDCTTGETKYKLDSCKEGYVVSGNSCALKVCTIKTCPEYGYSFCPTGANCSSCTETTSSCISRNKFKIKSCKNGYIAQIDFGTGEIKQCSAGSIGGGGSTGPTCNGTQTTCNGKKCCCKTGQSCNGPQFCICESDDGDLIQPDPGLSCPGGYQGSSCNCGGTHKEIGYTPGHYCTGR